MPEQELEILRYPPSYAMGGTPDFPERVDFSRLALSQEVIPHENNLPIDTGMAARVAKPIPGYWAIQMPKLSASSIRKMVLALKLMSDRNEPLACAYIDSHEVVARFDFRKRSLERTYVLRGDAHLFGQGPVAVGSAQDSDAIIAAGTYSMTSRPKEEIDADLKVLRDQLIQHFAYRGIHIFVKPNKNDILMSHNCSQEETRARELLYQLIGPEEFKRYLKRGSLYVKAASGRIYAIHGGYSHVNCYHSENGDYRLKESLCIQFEENLTYTDGVIMRKLLIESNEEGMRKNSNITLIPPAEISVAERRRRPKERDNLNLAAHIGAAIQEVCVQGRMD